MTDVGRSGGRNESPQERGQRVMRNAQLGRTDKAPNPQILDACCGSRAWWWEKHHPLAVYMDKRTVAAGARADRPNWQCEPDVVGDFRAMPFEDGEFRLVVFDPPHIIREEPRGNIGLFYGALPRDTEQDDLRQGFAECWRVLAPGGTLIFKWAGDIARVRPLFPSTPVVGTRSPRRVKGDSALPTRWFVFYKPLLAVEQTQEEAAACGGRSAGHRGSGAGGGMSQSENVAEPGCAYIVTPQMKRLADDHALLEADLARLRHAARLVVDAEYRREQWGSDTVATFDRAIQGLRERLGRA
jgi:SAM-dependent methyltransferase